MHEFPWIQLRDGSEFDLLPPYSKTPSVAVIAHSLALINRFAGHTRRPYSVAEHSCLCYELSKQAWPQADPILYLAVLCHDAVECIIGDCSSPVKRVVGEGWYSMEYQMEQAILDGLWPGLNYASEVNRDKIRRCDLTALWIERRDLVIRRSTRLWPGIDSDEFRPIETKLRVYEAESPWTFWRDKFIANYTELLPASMRA